MPLLARFAGPAFAIAFVLLSAVRDVYFSGLFQGLGFWGVILLAFGLSSAMLLAVAAATPRDIALLLRHPWPVAVVNGATALAWIGFFHGLKVLEPAIVNTVYNGMGPLTIVVVAWRAARRPGAVAAPVGAMLRVRQAAALALGATILALGLVVVSGRSGVASGPPWRDLLGLGGAAAGGVAISVGHLYARQLSDAGVTEAGVFGARFLLAVAIAAAAEAASGGAVLSGALGARATLLLAGAALALVVMPSFLLQFAVSRTDPLPLNVIRALGPVLVFAAQRVEGRVGFSGWTLACILAYCTIAIGGALAEVAALRRPRA
ncbi:MAG: hypothetical protein IT557_01030 [Alphaproteobacteria bacterium]|nr:hypothetical protein [Alphaproteobacteria bacterium]